MCFRILVVAALSSVALAQSDVALTIDRLTLKGVVAEATEFQGRRAIRLLEADNARNGGVAMVNDISFRDGTIEIDVAGRRGPYAIAEDRGFIGIAFRVSPTAERYEYIYVRPDNGRANDQVRRNHSTQYSSHPDFPWPRMRKEFPERYEAYVDLEYGAWTRLRVTVDNTIARLFVHDAQQPTLIVNDLKLGSGEGGVALWIGAGTEGFFSNLRVQRR